MGFPNIGNTCYFSCALHAIISMQPDAYTSGTDGYRDLLQQLQKLTNSFQLGYQHDAHEAFEKLLEFFKLDKLIEGSTSFATICKLCATQQADLKHSQPCFLRTVTV